MAAMRMRCLAIMIAAALCGSIAEAATGPLMQPLVVTQMYTKDSNSTVYVAFQTGAMPSCYGDAGGYLYFTNARFKELYTQLLTIIATKSIKGSIIYTHHGSTGNWGDCTIDGLYLFPD